MYIELNRTFRKLTESDDDTGIDLDWIGLSAEKTIWSDILSKYRTIILSEAGSGKTEEIRQITQQLRAQGKIAFFMRLENIADDFELAFEEGSLDEFENWISSNDEAWLLLDSIDEAKLRSPRDFDTAIKKIGLKLKLSFQRVHIILTGRASAWRPKTDLELCSKQLPYTRPIENTEEKENISQQDEQEPTFTILALEDLAVKQIEHFAKASGVLDTQQFLDALERAEAWTHTKRPQDLVEIIDFWLCENRIGSRLELMQNSINQRLRESDQNRDLIIPISTEKTRNGAKLVASASTLTRKQIILVPDSQSKADGLSINKVLNDWTALECSALLSRPIFDEAIYGTVRFHHRSVREYLTAEWFADLLKNEASRQRIEELFFKKQYGINVIVPSMRPILPWLVIFDEKICEKVSTMAPEIFFEGGDPSQLPLITRNQILSRVCNQISNQGSQHSSSDSNAIQRFATPDLSDEIRRLFHLYRSDDEVIWLLMRMVWQGELSSLLPEAIQIAESPTTERYTRTAALRAVFSLGSDIEKNNLRDRYLNESTELKRDILAEFVQSLSNSDINIEWLFACFNKAKAPNENNVDLLKRETTSLVQRCNLPFLAPFIEKATLLFNEPPLGKQEDSKISVKYAWIFEPAAFAVKHLILERNSEALNSSSLSILSMYTHYEREHHLDFDRDNKNNLKQLVQEWPELNLTLFWFLVENKRQELGESKKEGLDHWRRVGTWNSVVGFAINDFESIIEFIASRPLIDDKLIALSLAFELYLQSGRQPEKRRTLKKSVCGNPVLEEKLSNFMCPPKQTEEERKRNKKQRQQEVRWKKQNDSRKQREGIRHAEWYEYLNENIEKLRDNGLKGANNLSNAQLYLYDQLHQLSEDNSSRSESNWQLLVSKFGQSVALAFRDGAVSYWRNNLPILRSEGAPANSTPYITCFGLIGLAIEANEIPLWPSTLTEKDAETAFRYAMHELNGFPFWFEQLFSIFPGLICKLSLEEINYELANENVETESHYLLSRIVWSGKWIWDSLASKLCSAIQSSEPRNLQSLDKILNIIQGSSISNEAITKLATTRVTTSEHVREAYWFAVWTGVNPSEAISEFEDYLKVLSDDATKTTCAMVYVAQLLGTRLSRGTYVRDNFKTPKYLKHLYLLMHQYIKESEDIDRASGGVYSPELRDDAQDGRDKLIRLLCNISGKETFEALLSISDQHPNGNVRSWLKREAKTRAEQDIDLIPWIANDICHFQNEQEKTPRNHNELFELAVMRIRDLKHDLEDGDSSIASILKPIKLETEIRKFIGNWCRDRSRGRYSIPQEEELADAKRPDFRWHSSGIDCPVPMELKLADKWSGPDLFERLEAQLCGQYLRDTRSSRGIFLLVYHGNKQHWERPDTDDKLNFENLIHNLQNHWDDISHRFTNIDEIRVIGIDLTKRTS
ncbi:hypothetical protein GCM10009410_01550 [Shewanella ulleungensis]|uniref:ATP-binding protein n=2 Tax=Shewanella ulleungensis TaxID=2282699 RepID=A0ABQ2QE90_9GAMM|nr:hypothetical protein GCM10009410_01550 [Shewanella ulleungensis]